MLDPERGDKIYKWIADRFSEGRTVYVQTYGRATKLSSKHLAMLRVRNGHCEMQRGRHWDSINWCKLTARAE